eukprot:939592-Prymnesium_polylepis.1
MAVPFVFAVYWDSSPHDSFFHTLTKDPLHLLFWFFSGLVLQRLGVVAFATQQLLTRPWLRVVPLLVLVGLIVPCAVSPYEPLHWKFMPTDHAGYYWNLLFASLAIFSWAGVTPVSRLPIITSGGGRTLTAYLFTVHGAAQTIQWIYAHILRPIFADSEASCWIIFVFVTPIMVAFFTSELVAVAMWPIVTPTWAVALLTGKASSPPPVVMRWSAAAGTLMGAWRLTRWRQLGPWLLWAVLLVMLTAFIMFIQSEMGTSDDMPRPLASPKVWKGVKATSARGLDLQNQHHLGAPRDV